MTQKNQIYKIKFLVLAKLLKIQPKTDYNAKITEIENKIASITGLNTNAALTAAENTISDVSNLV